MLTCEQALKVLYAYLDGELAPADVEGVEGHIQKCKECFGHVVLERKILAYVREKVGGETAPESLSQRVKDLLKRL